MGGKEYVDEHDVNSLQNLFVQQLLAMMSHAVNLACIVKHHHNETDVPSL